MLPLISVDELATSMGRVRVCDIRWELTNPNVGRAKYESGHIPEAVFFDLDRDLSATPGLWGRHPLPDAVDSVDVLGRLGIDPDTPVVAYDDVSGRIAARLWWMLSSIGHDDARVLDGGYQAWVDAGHDVGVGTVTPVPVIYPGPREFTGVVTAEDLQHRIVIDARSEERYRGEVEPVDAKAGHIPGAINIPSSQNLGDDGRFLGPEALQSIYGELADPVVSCGSGVTACHDALAMVVAGFTMPDLYVGSFSEWSRRDLPVETGPNP